MECLLSTARRGVVRDECSYMVLPKVATVLPRLLHGMKELLDYLPLMTGAVLFTHPLWRSARSLLQRSRSEVHTYSPVPSHGEGAFLPPSQSPNP